jgi:hypothetical protein
LPLEDVLSLDWMVQFFPDEQATYDYRGTNLGQAAILEQLRPFDECGLFCAAAFTRSSFERVILVSDHLTNWNDSTEVDFSEYVDFVFESAGLVEARMDWLLRAEQIRGQELRLHHDQ